MAWQRQEAEQRFGELVRQAQDEGPFVTRHGEEVAFVMSAKTHRALGGTRPGPDFRRFLASAPDPVALGLIRDELPGTPEP